MGAFEIFVIRAFLAVFFSILLSRFYFKDRSIFWSLGLAVLMLAIVYAKEYFRKRNQGE
ncbi:MAG: hypothetical protein ACK4WB_00265 [Desulfatiglandales bacterium]